MLCTTRAQFANGGHYRIGSLRRECSTFNPLYTTGLCHCYMLDKYICQGVQSILLLLFYFWWEILLANSVDSIRHHIMWHLTWVCTVCLWLYYGFPGRNGLGKQIWSQKKLFPLKQEFHGRSYISPIWTLPQAEVNQKTQHMSPYPY